MALGGHTVHVSNVGGASKEDLRASTAIVDSRLVSVNVVGEEVLVAARDVHSGIGGTVPSSEVVAHGDAGHLRGILEGLLDDFVIVVEEVRTKTLVVGFLGLGHVVEGEIFKKKVGVKGGGAVMRDPVLAKVVRFHVTGVGTEVVLIVVDLSVIAEFIKVLVEGDVRTFKGIEEIFVVGVKGIVKGQGIPFGGGGDDFVGKFIKLLVGRGVELHVGKGLVNQRGMM